MQVKGIVKLFLVLLVLVVLLQYLYILPTRKVEKNAEKYAEKLAAKAPEGTDVYEFKKEVVSKYLDSMSSEVIFRIPLFAKYTYDDLKKSQLALGLDLKGGMSVILQVNLKDFLLTLSGNSQDATFHKALDNAEKAMANSQDDYITLFYQEWKKIAGDKKLAKIFVRNQAVRDAGNLNYNSTDDEVLAFLKKKGDETIKLTFNMLKQRIDKLGVVQPNVSLDENRNLILVELPGIDNPQRARNFLQASAKLEFWNVYRMSDPGIIEAFVAADKKLKNEMSADSSLLSSADSVMYDTIYEPVLDSLGNTVDSTMKVVEKENPMSQVGPLLSKLQLSASSSQGADTPIAGYADKNKKDAISDMLKRPEIKALFPKDLIFRWSMKPIKDQDSGELTNTYELYILKKEPGSDRPPLEGDHVTRAAPNIDQSNGGQVEVTLSMDQKGAKKWAEMTT
ncbi:MAG TPA: protein translocase subunit SecDF, partial [Bacteroidetes bacterium]|nr:protein translocase subunit SecDF [Bacteroidota bacterium]